MRKTMIIPTYWCRRTGELWQEGDAVYDHPTPVDQEGTLERTLLSMKQFHEKDFKLVILICPTTPEVEEEAYGQVLRITRRAQLNAETYKRKKYAVCGKGRAELPEPDFACRSFRPVGILLGSAFPAKIGGKPGRFGVQCNSSASNKSHGFLCWYEAGGAGGRHQSEPCVSRKCQRQPLRTVGCGTGECPIPSS